MSAKFHLNWPVGCFDVKRSFVTQEIELKKLSFLIIYFFVRVVIYFLLFLVVQNVLVLKLCQMHSRVRHYKFYFCTMRTSKTKSGEVVVVM